MASCHHEVVPSSKMLSHPVQVVADSEEVDGVVGVLLLKVVHCLLVERLAGHPLAKDLLAELNIVGSSDVQADKQNSFVSASDGSHTLQSSCCVLLILGSGEKK